MSPERGIYTSPDDRDFKSDNDIKREAYLRGERVEFEHKTKLPKEKDASYWFEHFIDRADEFKDREQREQHIEITAPISHALIGLISDTHIGSGETDYRLLERDVGLIENTPGAYAIVVGDLLNGMYWGGASHMAEVEQTPEQLKFMRSILRKLGDENKLIAGFSGDHDGWMKKMGANPYDRLAEEAHAHYMEGVGYITANVGDETYKLTGGHRLRGSSIYNDAHAGIRNTKEIEGSDVVFSGHHHGKKAHLEQVKKEHGGGGRLVHAIQLGNYDRSGEYARKMGYADLPDESLGASAVLLYGLEHRIEYFNDLAHGIHALMEKNE